MASKKSKQTFFRSPISIAIAAFIVLFVVFWGFYSKSYNSNTNQTAAISSETADWRTYTNTERGYSFKYPAGYTLTKNQATANNFENVSLEKDAEIVQDGGMGGGDAIVGGSIISFTILPQKNLSEAELKSNYGSDTVVSQAQLGGKEVTKAALDTYPASERYFYFYNPEVLEIAANVPNTELNQAKFSEYNDEYKQILSTFKFTD